MNKLLLQLVLCLYSSASFGKLDTTYFNAGWEKTNKKNATYYRITSLGNNGLFNVWDYFLKSNKLQMSGIYMDAKAEIRNGYFNYYFPNGKKSEEGAYDKNFPDGEWKYYYTSGTLKRVRHFVRGLPEGKHMFFDSLSHKLFFEENYLHGKLHGEYISYFRGKDFKHNLRTYKYDRLNGLAINYDSASQKKLDEGMYENDLRTGKWHFYPWEGHTWGVLEPDLHIYLTFEHDKLNGPAEYYDLNGKLLAKGLFILEQQSGKWTYHHNDPGPWVIEEGYFNNGKRTGLWNQFLESTGLIFASQKYVDGEKDGATVYYDKYGVKVKD